MTSDDSFAGLYPFTSNYLEIGTLRYHYLDEGDGSPVVMLHGNPTWSFYYRNLVAGLRDTHRIIVPDHIGCGFSDKPQDYPYRMADHLHNVSALIDHLKLDQFTLVMHDWGGPIGLAYTVSNPDRVEQFVVFNTTPMQTRHLPWRILMCKLPVLGDILIRGFNGFALGASFMASCNPDKMTAPVRRAYLKPYDSWANRIATLRFVQDIPLSSHHPSAALIADIRSRIHELRDKRTLLCWGDRDFCFTEAFLNEWRDFFPNAEVHRFANAGHYVLEDAIDGILPLVKTFLRG